jgi:hypothetical protein
VGRAIQGSSPRRTTSLQAQSARNAIAEGGFFEHYTDLSISFASEAFGEKNGA